MRWWWWSGVCTFLPGLSCGAGLHRCTQSCGQCSWRRAGSGRTGRPLTLVSPMARGEGSVTLILRSLHLSHAFFAIDDCDDGFMARARWRSRVGRRTGRRCPIQDFLARPSAANSASPPAPTAHQLPAVTGRASPSSSAVLARGSSQRAASSTGRLLCCVVVARAARIAPGAPRRRPITCRPRAPPPQRRQQLTLHASSPSPTRPPPPPTRHQPAESRSRRPFLPRVPQIPRCQCAISAPPRAVDHCVHRPQLPPSPSRRRVVCALAATVCTVAGQRSQGLGPSKLCVSPGAIRRLTALSRDLRQRFISRARYRPFVAGIFPLGPPGHDCPRLCVLEKLTAPASITAPALLLRVLTFGFARLHFQ